MVKFLCPNGHQLNAPPNLVGKAGKCPKCGTAFIVPSPDEDSSSESFHEAELGSLVTPGSSPSQKSTPGSGKVPVVPASASGSSASGIGSTPRPLPANSFYFLCPNGHKLNGPVTLKGKLGQCPHCSSKFLVPEDEPEPEMPQDSDEDLDDDLADNDLADDGEPEYHSVDEEDSLYDELPESEVEAEILDLPPVDEQELPNPADPDSVGPSEAFRHYLAPELAEPEFEHPLAEILAKIWESKGEAGEVELLLKDGTTLAPDHYAPQLSKRAFALFATFDGVSYSMLALPWKSIQRMTLNKIDALPSELFGND